MKTFREFILECYNISEGSEIAGRLADLAQKNADKLFQGTRGYDPNRARIQTYQRIADLARARSLDKPEPRYAGLTYPPVDNSGTPANLPPRRTVFGRGGSGSPEDNDRDIGTKDTRFLDFANGRRDNPNMSTREREEREDGNEYRQLLRRTRARRSRGQSASSAGAGSASGTTGEGQYQVGGGEGDGVLGIKLAN